MVDTDSQSQVATNVSSSLWRVVTISVGAVLVFVLICGAAWLVEVRPAWSTDHSDKGLSSDPRVPRPLVLRELDNGATFDLADYLGRRPVALVFGAYSCPIARSHFATLNELYRKYADEIEFRFVYIREAHPASELWRENLRDGVNMPQPMDYNERVNNARVMRDKAKLDFPIVIDELDDRVMDAYAAFPVSFCIVGRDGLVQYVGGMTNSPGVFATMVGELAGDLEIEDTIEIGGENLGESRSITAKANGTSQLASRSHLAVKDCNNG